MKTEDNGLPPPEILLVAAITEKTVAEIEAQSEQGEKPISPKIYYDRFGYPNPIPPPLI